MILFVIFIATHNLVNTSNIYIYIHFQEAAFVALRPLIKELMVDSDFQVRMQQDNSINPSVIDTIFTNDMIHSSYT